MTSPMPQTTTVESKNHILYQHTSLSMLLSRRREWDNEPVSYGLRDVDERRATKEHYEEDANPFGRDVVVR